MPRRMRGGMEPLDLVSQAWVAPKILNPKPLTIIVGILAEGIDFKDFTPAILIAFRPIRWY